SVRANRESIRNGNGYPMIANRYRREKVRNAIAACVLSNGGEPAAAIRKVAYFNWYVRYRGTRLVGHPHDESAMILWRDRVMTADPTQQGEQEDDGYKVLCHKTAGKLRTRRPQIAWISLFVL